VFIEAFYKQATSLTTVQTDKSFTFCFVCIVRQQLATSNHTMSPSNWQLQQ